MAGDFRNCCRSRRGKGPHVRGCVHFEPCEKAVRREVARKIKEFTPPDGAWVKMHRLEGVWVASLVLLDGKTAEVEDRDWFHCLEMLAHRIANEPQQV